jgi:hypothetical protein
LLERDTGNIYLSAEALEASADISWNQSVAGLPSFADSRLVCLKKQTS